jgi:hypothetical protein
MNPFRTLFKSRSSGEGANVAEAGNTASSPAVDQAAINKAVSDALAAALPNAISSAVTAAIKPLADNQKVLADTLAALPPAKKEEGGGGEAKPLTAEDVGKLLDQKLTAQQQSAAAAAARTAFAGSKLKDLPQAYQDKLGNDPAKWAGEEQAIREQFKSDMKALGVEPKTVGGAATSDGGITAAADKPDLSKMNPVQLIALGLKQHPVAGSLPAAHGAGAGAGGAGAAQGSGAASAATAGAGK